MCTYPRTHNKKKGHDDDIQRLWKLFNSTRNLQHWIGKTISVMESLQWCDLPSDLLESICKHLDPDYALPCLRSVCTSWRSSVSSDSHHTKNSFLEFPLHLPLWSSPPSDIPNQHFPAGFFCLNQSKIYRVEQVNLSLTESISEQRIWLLKVQQARTPSGKMRIFNLLSGGKACDLTDEFPRLIDFSDFRISVIGKSYHMEYVNSCGKQGICSIGQHCYDYYSLHADKTVAIHSQDGGFYSIIAIHSAGKLGLLRSDDPNMKWTILDHSWDVIYDDVITYEGGFCVVNDKGNTKVFDLLFNSHEIASDLPGGGGHKKRLVDVSGDLVMIDKHVRHCWGNSEFSDLGLSFRVYKLNKMRKEWEEVRFLGDLIVFVGDDSSFWVSAADFPELKGNSIVCKEHYRNGVGSTCNGVYSDEDRVVVFNVGDQSLLPQSFPSLYSSAFFSSGFDKFTQVSEQ